MIANDSKLPISVVIISRDAAAVIPACLKSVAFARDVVVVDSGSGDGTVDVVRQAGARVIHQEWLGFGPQKQFAVEQAVYDWVLCLDTDERVSVELEASLRMVLDNLQYNAYAMPRCNVFMGRWLKHGEGYPDWSLRFFDRRHARWSDDSVHERVATSEAVGKLRGDLLHESAEDLATYLVKQNRYTTLQAEALFQRRKKTSAAQMVLSPFARFIKFYFVRLGFLDGLPGLVHILIGCFNSFIKYAKLRELIRKNATT